MTSLLITSRWQDTHHGFACVSSRWSLNISDDVSCD